MLWMATRKCGSRAGWRPSHVWKIFFMVLSCCWSRWVSYVGCACVVSLVVSVYAWSCPGQMLFCLWGGVMLLCGVPACVTLRMMRPVLTKTLISYLWYSCGRPTACSWHLSLGAFWNALDLEGLWTWLGSFALVLSPSGYTSRALSWVCVCVFVKPCLQGFSSPLNV